jgi:hypothetical protein
LVKRSFRKIIRNNQTSVQESLLMVNLVALKRAGWVVWWPWPPVYLELVYLVTALVPSDTACLASRSLTAVCTSLVLLLL